MNVQTTLNFYGRTEEAVNFYCRTIEAQTLFMMRFRDHPDPSQSKPGLEEKIFHATFRIGSTEIMASDCGCEMLPAETTFAGFSLLLRVETSGKPTGSSRPWAREVRFRSLWWKHFLQRATESSLIALASPGRSWSGLKPN